MMAVRVAFLCSAIWYEKLLFRSEDVVCEEGCDLMNATMPTCSECVAVVVGGCCNSRPGRHS